MNQGQRIIPTFRKFLFNHLRLNRLPPLHLYLARFLPALQRYIKPLVGKSPVHTNQHLLLHEITQGSLHH